MDKIGIKAPAKINLFLDILGKLPNGYHEIKSVMQTVDLFDYVKVAKADKIKIKLSVIDKILFIFFELIVKIFYNLPGSRIAYNLSQLSLRCLTHLRYCLKSLEQSIQALCSDALNLLQLAIDKCLAALLAVERNTKPMRLVADALDQVQLRRVVIQENGLLPVRQEDLFLLFCQAEHGNFISPMPDIYAYIE